jgi:hypothetical protein
MAGTVGIVDVTVDGELDILVIVVDNDPRKTTGSKKR